MSNTNLPPKHVWNTYTSSWLVEGKSEKLAIFDTCLSDDCTYNDPSAKTQGWDELAEQMLAFHQQVPGGHFVTTYFLAHSDKSIARWDMKDANGQTIGEGISYGEYNAQGKLTSMTGFF